MPKQILLHIYIASGKTGCGVQVEKSPMRTNTMYKDEIFDRKTGKLRFNNICRACRIACAQASIISAVRAVSLVRTCAHKEGN